MNTRQKTFMIALGGNSILRKSERGTLQEQFANLWRTCEQLLDLMRGKPRVVITHGNGPQVGNLFLASEMAKDIVPPMTLDICDAATQGFIGYMIQQTLANQLRTLGLKHNITTVISQVIVDKDDPAFARPTKPIGPFYNASEAEKLRCNKGWHMIEDSTRGYRRVVPSPRPTGIQEARIIKHMLDNGEIVIAAGGGGIPVVREPNRSLRGVEAVIDKDLTSSCLAVELDVDILFILTAVECVYRDFGLTSQRALERLSVDEAKNLLAEGQFGAGSMEPKIQAAIEFLESPRSSPSAPEREVIITLPETVNEALQGKTGTRISKRFT